MSEPSRWKQAATDVVLVLLAVIHGAVSLGYPFGRDQALYHVIGREWLNGAIPYLDLFDQKTPLIYLVHAGTILVFGSNTWGIHLVELVFVVGLGFAMGWASARWAGVGSVAGYGGLGALVLSMFYFGTFDFWSVAQCEIWMVGLTVLAIACGRSAPHRPWAGLLFGLALLAKPPALFLLPAVLIAMASRLVEDGAGRKAILRTAGVFAAAATAPILLVLLYFLAVGGLGAFYDVVVAANAHYVEHGAQANSMAQRVVHLTDAFWTLGLASWLGPVVLALWFLLGPGRRERREWWIAGCALTLWGGALVAVYVQNKYFLYHWGAVMVASSFAWVVAAALFGAAARSRSSTALAGSMSLLVAAVALGVFHTSPAQEDWKAMVRVTRDYYLTDGRQAWCEAISPRPTARAPWLQVAEYHWCIEEDVGLWLKRHAQPGDKVAVRGFAPAIYVVSGLPPASRFFWTAWLFDPHRTYRRQHFLKQDRDQLTAARPRFVVVLSWAKTGPDSTSYITWGDYVERAVFEDYAVLELTGSRGPRSRR